MDTFPGGLRILGQSGRKIDVKLDLTSEALELHTDNYHIGTWKLADVTVEHRQDGIILRLDDEGALFAPDNDEEFLLAARAAGVLSGAEPLPPERQSPERSINKPTGKHRKPNRFRPNGGDRSDDLPS